eukprot:SAG31_NODE_31030_length_373_cov_0.806569_1_plen_93_part_10
MMSHLLSPISGWQHDGHTFRCMIQACDKSSHAVHLKTNQSVRPLMETIERGLVILYATIAPDEVTRLGSHSIETVRSPTSRTTLAFDEFANLD